MIPDLTFWWRLFALLALESAAAVAIAWAVARVTQSAVLCRFVWRTAMVCLLLVTVTNLTGIGHLATQYLWRARDSANPDYVPPVEKRVDVHRDEKNGLSVTRTISVRQPDINKAIWWPAVIWLLGAVAICTRLATAHGLLMILRRMRRPIKCEEASRLAKMFGIRRRVVVVPAHGINAPFAFGIFGAVIVVPDSFEEKFSSKEREVIITHELAHLAAHDPVWHSATSFITAMLWWHPLVWMARRWLHDAAELAADEAVARIENGPETLASCLVAMARQVTGVWRWGGVAMNGTERPSNLRRRIERLMILRDEKLFCPSFRQGILRIVAALCFLAVTFVVVGWAQDNPTLIQTNGKANLQNSPVAVVWRSMTGKVPATPSLLPAMLQNGKVLYEQGKLAQAMGQLKMVTMIDPSNKAAFYYLELIREAGYKNRAARRERTNPDWLYPTFPAKPVFGGGDPTGTGLWIQPQREGSDTNPELLYPTLPAKPVFGDNPLIGMEAAQPVPLIYQTSTQPTTLTVAPVVIADTNAALYSKTFHLNPTAVLENLKAWRGDVVKAAAVQNQPLNVVLHRALKDWFKELGVDFKQSGKALFFNDRTGLMLVRGTLQDLETVETAATALNSTEAQILINAKLLELDASAEKTLKRRIEDVKNLKPDDYASLLSTLLKTTGTVIVAAPTMSTLSGRPAMLSIGSDAPGAPRISIQVTPKLTLDGYSIQLDCVVSQFSGPDDQAKSRVMPVSGVLPDGYTLVAISDDSKTSAKKLVAFITATVIDKRGNRVHSQAESDKHAQQ